jgi:hypothetical protein
MWLPRELAMLVGSFLDPHDLQVCTTQLCSRGAEFVSAGLTNDATIIILHELVGCCQLSSGVVHFVNNLFRLVFGVAAVDDVVHECTKRIESFVNRRGNVQTIVIDAQLRDEHATNASVYSDFHRHLQQGSSFQLGQNNLITVEWHVRAQFIAQIKFLLKVDVRKDGAGGVSDSSGGGAIRQYLHTLDLSHTRASDVSTTLASCKSLHTLNLSSTQVSDVSGLASCTSLHTLELGWTQVSDVSSLASCPSHAEPAPYSSERCVYACIVSESSFAGPVEYPSD